VLVAALAGGGLAACSREEVPAHIPLPTKPEYANYCFRSLETAGFPQPQLDIASLSDADRASIFKAYAAGLLGQARIMQGEAPDEVEADVDVVVDTIARVSETGDLSLLEGEQVREARARVHAFEAENCGWAKQEIGAVEYAYQNVPVNMPAGAWSLHLTNTGAERHELVLLRVNDHVIDSGRQILDTPQELAFTKVHSVGSATADPGGDAYVVATLHPGRYLMVCYLPVGGRGAPHFTRGMSAEVIVA
jgi:hypothetical protein